MYKFMQIWGNCLALYTLGENGVKGPVDNLITKNKKVLELLFNDKYLDYIKGAEFTESSRPIGFEGDSPVAYETSVLRIVHNNPHLDSYKKRTEERCQNLKDFLAELPKNKNYYLVYSLNNFDINRKMHTLRGKTLITNIEYLKKLSILDRVIFVGTVGKDWTNFWSNDLITIIKKYKLKYIEITGIKSWIDSSKEDLAGWHQQFMWGFEDTIKNGTNKKYLAKRDSSGKYIQEKPKKAKPQAKKETKKYYLYF